MLGKVAPGVTKTLDGMAVYVGGAPVVSTLLVVPLLYVVFFRIPSTPTDK